MILACGFLSGKKYIDHFITIFKFIIIPFFSVEFIPGLFYCKGWWISAIFPIELTNCGHEIIYFESIPPLILDSKKYV